MVGTLAPNDETNKTLRSSHCAAQNVPQPTSNEEVFFCMGRTFPHNALQHAMVHDYVRVENKFRVSS
jgi:hypothetical protein